ncbi:formyl transferase [Phaeosphaeriaceae sp. PMI808]|nr:formyl transferase [Phaeosphaeriaceae sp. PMI808]
MFLSRRLLTSVRSLTHTHTHTHTLTTLAQQNTAEPLRILFCGSDDFSIASLRALAKAQREIPNLIQSLDVVHRPPKLTGRGLKTLRPVPISKVASSELSLPTHTIDTFTGWTPPPTDLIIAVSFGLFVPPRILSLAKYGGINVHPSLLPDLRGPAPIEHAILKHKEYTGVSVQTLHSEHYDHGVVLAQSHEPGLRISLEMSVAALTDQLAVQGARMLVDTLRAGRFMPPCNDMGWHARSKRPVGHAPKITKQDRFVDFGVKSIKDILAMQRALGDLWSTLPNGDRVIMHSLVDTATQHYPQEPGIWNQKGSNYPMFRAACGGIGVISKSTYAGAKAQCGNVKVLKSLPEKDIPLNVTFEQSCAT